MNDSSITRLIGRESTQWEAIYAARTSQPIEGENITNIEFEN